MVIVYLAAHTAWEFVRSAEHVMLIQTVNPNAPKIFTHEFLFFVDAGSASQSQNHAE